MLRREEIAMDNIFFVLQLYSQIDELKREAQQKGADAEATRQELQNEITLKVMRPSSPL